MQSGNVDTQPFEEEATNFERTFATVIFAAVGRKRFVGFTAIADPSKDTH